MKIIDMHCDTVWALIKRKRENLSCDLRTSDTQLNLQMMQSNDYLMQNFAIFVDMAATDNPFEEALRMIALYYDQIEKNTDIISPVYTYQDVLDNIKNDKMSALLTLEEGGMCKGEPEFLSILQRLGARMMTITWNYENDLGFPNKTERGLKEKGFSFLSEMERLGIIIDVSHLSDAGFYDVLSHTKKPFVASHSNARSVCNVPRNLTDDMIRKLAERGGITGINFCKDFLGEPSPQQDYLHMAVMQMKYLVNIGGEDFVGLGSDFDGITPYDDFKDCTVMPKLIDYMKKEGFSHTQIEKIFFKNVLNLYQELL